MNRAEPSRAEPSRAFMCRAFSDCRYPFRSQPHHRYKLASVANLTQTAMFPVDCMCMFPPSRIPGTASTRSLFQDSRQKQTRKVQSPNRSLPLLPCPFLFTAVCTHSNSAFPFYYLLCSLLSFFASISPPCSSAVDVTRKMSKVKHKRFVTTFLPYPRV